MSEKTICPTCGTTTMKWTERRMGEMITLSRDFYPVSFIVRLKAGTNTTYIVPPEIERHAIRIRSLNGGKLDYAVDVALPESGFLMSLFNADERIGEWHTETSAPVCESHTEFVDKRWK